MIYVCLVLSIINFVLVLLCKEDISNLRKLYSLYYKQLKLNLMSTYGMFVRNNKGELK